MKSKLTITIKKKSQTSWLIGLVIMLPFLFGTLNDLLGLPWAIRYLIDVAWVAMILLMLLHQHSVKSKGTKSLVLWSVLFLTFTLLVYLVQYQSALYYLWGFRNNFRFYAAFFIFATFLSSGGVEAYLKVFDKLFWVNVVVSLVQYFLLELEGDYLGGIFGAEIGGNGYTNIFFVIVITKSIILYLEKKETAKDCVCKIVAALAVAALAELKFFFVEVLVIIALASLFTKFTWRKFWVIVGGLGAVFLGAALLVAIFPNFAGFLSIDWLREAASSDEGYTSSGDLNRLNSIVRINELWLRNWGQRVFGLGLGNCETSSFALLNTPFFEQYGHMHYTWMSYAMMYLECGWVGLVFYFGFFVLIYFAIQKIEKRSDGMLRSYCRISRIMAVCCALISVYNSSLRTEAGYMAYFVLAIPFALGRNMDKTQKKTIEAV